MKLHTTRSDIAECRNNLQWMDEKPHKEEIKTSIFHRGKIALNHILNEERAVTMCDVQESLGHICH